MANFIGLPTDDNFDGTQKGDYFDLSAGGHDTANGFSGQDVFYMGGAFDADDHIDGGRGFDIMDLAGDYSAGLTLGPDTLVSVELLRLAGSFSYDLTLDDANVGPRNGLTVDASTLHHGGTLTLDASAETKGDLTVVSAGGDDSILLGAGNDLVHAGRGDDTVSGGGGNDTIFGGRGIDDLSGGAGHDTFAYSGVRDSTNEEYDTIDEFDVARDHIDLDVFVKAMNDTLTTGSLSDGPTYVSDFETNITASRLGAHHAVVWIPDSGTDAGDIYVVIDANGIAGFQSGQDYIIELEDPANLGNLDETTFI